MSLAAPSIRDPRLHKAWNWLWPLAKRYWFDAVILAAIGISIAVAIADQGKARRDAPQGPLWFDVLAAVACIVPLFARRRYPFVAPVATVVLLAGTSFIDGGLTSDDWMLFLSAIASAFLFGMLRERRQAFAGLAILVGVDAIVSHNGPNSAVGDFIWGLIVFSIAWTVGFGLSQKFREGEEAMERADRLERARAEEARLAVAEERARVARELHDIVGHGVSVMTVQAAGVRRLLRPHQEREREALMVVDRRSRHSRASSTWTSSSSKRARPASPSSCAWRASRSSCPPEST